MLTYDSFVARVQGRGRMPTPADATAAIRATLTTLSERLNPDEAQRLASRLPPEIAAYLKSRPSEPGQWSTWESFYERVARRETEEVSPALFHARCVLEAIQEVISGSSPRKAVAAGGTLSM